jgi:hypothetical protein
MIDILTELNAIHRRVATTGSAGEIVTVLVERSYPTTTDDVWEALTDLIGVIADDPTAAGNTPEAREFSRQSILARVTATEASGTATAEEIAAATAVSMAQFAPDLPAAGQDGAPTPDGVR